MQRSSSTNLPNGSGLQSRNSGENAPRSTYTTNGNSGMPIPQGQPAQLYNGLPRNGNVIPAPQPFDIARSPPNPATKNTKHVPCKFFRQGACQAGAACPFLHSTDSAVDTAPCKYFTKGNCKFGAKCALAHILPDGRRVNRPNMNMGMGLGMGMNGGRLNIGGRVDPPIYQNQDSALANSILTQQNYAVDPYTGQYPFMNTEDITFGQDRNLQYSNMPSIEAGVNSNPGSKYGSPVDESRLPMSPVGHHLTALDAPMPASFDSNGISHIARYGAVAASVPSKFGMESPPASLPQRAGPSDAYRALRNPAFNSNQRNTSPLGSSPPAAPDESISQRLLHSQKVSKPRVLSASVPRPGLVDDWEGFNLEEDLVPTMLHDDVLTPQEKMRRLSRPEQDFGGMREQSNALRIPSGNSSKVGSPLGSSPSRFSALFAKQREKKEQESNAASVSVFGHVGSPLRESLLPQASSPPLKPVSNIWATNEQTSAFSSPPRNSSTSMIAHQMHRMQLQKNEPTDLPGKSHPSRPPPGPTGRSDRNISSPRLGSTRIDEEQGDLVFSMDEESSKRSSVMWDSRSPHLRPLVEGTNGVLSRDSRENKLYTNGTENMFGMRQ